MKLRKGFTLIELLVVVAIIGILAAMILVALNAARTKARDSRIRADMAQIRTMAENSFSDDGNYNNIATEDGYADITTVVTGDIARNGGTAYGLTLSIAPSTHYCATVTMNDGATEMGISDEGITVSGTTAAVTCLAGILAGGNPM